MFLHTSSILGGSERAFLDLFENLTPKEQAESLVVLPSSGLLDRRIREINPHTRIVVLPFPGTSGMATQGAPVTAIAATIFSAPLFPGYFTSLSRLMEEHETEVIYSNGIKCHLISILLAGIQRKTLVWHLQDFFPKRKFLKMFLAAFSAGPDLVISNSLAVQNDARTWAPKHWRTEWKVVPNCVDPETYKVSGKIKKTGPLTVSLVGMLTPWKGQHVFLEAARRIHRKHPKVKFQIVGDEVYGQRGPSYKEQLQQAVIDSQMEEAVDFLGFVEDTGPVYEKSDIIVHASTRPEPFGRVVIEAMAFEKPVIATRGGGVTEIVNDGKNGLLAEMNDPASLARAMEKLITNRELRGRLGKAGRREVCRRFTAEYFSKEIRGALERVAGEYDV